MLFRFSLYGFLKNQRYFEPFLILVLRDRGLSFLSIGLLIGFREVCINLFEVPSGAMADMYGRRKSMIVSFASYIASFVIFAISPRVWTLFGAMFFFAIGDAFRTGTHKAMIFDWLAREGRQNERSKIYGFTRSWSKIGSAVSVVIGAGIVFWEGAYAAVFWYAIIPYALNIVNFLGYPSYLDGTEGKKARLGDVVCHLCDALKEAVTNRTLRGILLESMTHEGLYASVKDYLQPLLKHAAMALPVALSLAGERRSALLIGAVYFVLHVLEGMSSRSAHRIAHRLKGEQNAIAAVWAVELVLFSLLLVGAYNGWHAVGIVMFVILAACHNVFRPLMISRFDTEGNPRAAATILSVESQAKSAFTAVAAPILGAGVDYFGFGFVGVFGVACAAAVLAAKSLKGPRITNRRKNPAS